MTHVSPPTRAAITVDALTCDDAHAITELDAYAFVQNPDQPHPEAELDGLHFDRTFGVRGDAEPLRGVYTSFDLRLAQPGPLGSVRTGAVCGLSWVSVHPDHRRRGVLTEMIRHHLRDARARGYSWGALHASETEIYGRFGYAVASLDVSYTLNRGVTLHAPEWIDSDAAHVQINTVMRIDDAMVDRLIAVADAAAATELGTVTFPADLARRRLRDIPARRRPDREPLRALIARRDGHDVGFAVYHRNRDWRGSTPSGTVTVEQLVGTDPATMLALGRRLVDMDLMTEVKLSNRSVDDPLLWWAGGPRNARPTIADALWLRPLDVETALRQRGYAAPVDVVIEVDDELLGENTGRYRLHVGADGIAEVNRTRDDAHVSCRPGDLAAAHLGLRGWRAQSCTTVRAVDPSALNSLDAAYATGVAPIGGLSF